MQIDWTSKTINDWRNLIKEAPLSNYMQSWAFAKASHSVDQRMTRLGLIIEDNRPIGMMALQEVKLGPVHFIHLNRGPIWFREDPPLEWFQSFTEMLANEYPTRPFRRRRWLPEWKDSRQAADVLESHGFRSMKRNYQTVHLDLRRSEEDLRQGLHQKWRNALNKGERSKLEVVVDLNCRERQLFFKKYQEHRARKKYLGHSPKFLNAEIEAALPFEEAVILWGLDKSQPEAAILITLHGSGGTYRAGWTTENGRILNAHNVLLWNAVQFLKRKGCVIFDLGGIDILK
ncbi:MAG: hypothetical protein KDD22_05965, partial [Bdellovibrionales bacterium]|nr:hypothetical protein [Bdellovibrionales bacterium]